jgi:hypothetical protein
MASLNTTYDIMNVDQVKWISQILSYNRIVIGK